MVSIQVLLPKWVVFLLLGFRVLLNRIADRRISFQTLVKDIFTDVSFMYPGID